MTEAKWLNVDRYGPLVKYLKTGAASSRKLRLYASACVRLALAVVDIESCWEAVRVAEALADGQAGEADRQAAAERAYSRANDPAYSWAADPSTLFTRPANERAVAQVVLGASRLLNQDPVASLYVLDHIGHDLVPHHDSGDGVWMRVSILRCIFGNPFRPIVVEPTWLTETVVALAEGVYQERAFDRLPILADALEEAGCGSDDVLTHCRQPGEHVRGCWVIDLITGRK